jgi:hypothetical protein
MREATPLTVISNWPDLMTTISSLESTILGAVLWPTLSVVMWLSSSRKVSVGELTHVTREPVGVGVEGWRLQSMTEDGSLPGLLRGRLGGGSVREVSDEVDDVVGGGREADVGGVVGIVGGEEDQGAGAGVLLAAVDGDFEVAFLDEQHLFPGMTMDRVRLHAGVERSDVDFELVHGYGWVVEDGPDLADGGGVRGERVPVDEGGGEDGGVLRRSVGADDGGLLG